MTDCQVRRADPGELATVLDLATAFYVEAGFVTPVPQLSANLVLLLNSDNAHVAVACGHGDGIVGFAITTLTFGLEHGRVAELEDLYVRPAHRCSGIGGALIEDSVEWSQLRGCRLLELVVTPNSKNSDQLSGYYARRGFADEGRRLLSRNLAP
jgi:aminoglycoside 6'-N-acetyltransferase I